MLLYENLIQESHMQDTDENTKKISFTRILNIFDNLDNIDNLLLKIIILLKYIFILTMILYLFVCIMSLSHKIISLTINQGALDFQSIKIILIDGLFTLIVIAIVKTLFIKNGYDYAITFLEIGFVVVIRKLILLDTVPEEAMMTFTLGATSAMFFALIVYVHTIKNKKIGELT